MKDSCCGCCGQRRPFLGAYFSSRWQVNIGASHDVGVDPARSGTALIDVLPGGASVILLAQSLEATMKHLIILTALLVGCATSTGVVSMGGGKYSIMRSDYGPLGNLNDVKAQAYKDAAAFCAGHGKQPNIISTNGVPRALAQFPEAEVQFTCT